MKEYIHTKGTRHGNVFDENWVDEVSFTATDPFGEMSIRWYIVGGERAPRLEVFVESVKTLLTFSDVLSRIAEYSEKDGELTVAVFCSILKECGFTDETPKKKPKR